MRRSPPRLVVARVTAFVLAATLGTAAHADIYKCRTATGVRTSDRPLAGCLEQWQLNADGSQRRLVPAMQSDEERAAEEARKRLEDTQRATRDSDQRRDQNLLHRFPTKAVHDAARKSALDTVDTSIRTSQRRIERLKAERKPLESEREFYPGGNVPLKLKLAFDSNDALMDAQKQLIVNQQAEKERIDRTYDAELEKLRGLWGTKTGDAKARSN